MATGDLKNNLRKLQRLLRQVGYKEDVNYDGMSKGLPAAFLPLYHYALTTYSRHIAKRLSDADIHLLGTTDLKFVELTYRVLRDIFQYKPQVPKEKFFSAGFAERKVIMCTDVVTLVQKLHIQQEPRKPTTLSKSLLTSSSKAERPKSAPAQSNKTDPRGAYEPAAYASATAPKSKPGPRNSAQPLGHATRHPVEKQDVEKQEKLATVAPRKPMGRSVVAVGPSLPVAKSVVSFAESLDTQDLPVVEVVRMAEPSLQIDEQQLRPIDTIAQTPGRPVLREGPGPALSYIAQRLDDLVNRVTAMDDRLAAVETELGAQSNASATAVAPDAGQIQTILARLTLIEARMKSTDAKLMATCQTGRVVVAGPTAEEWTAEVNGHPSPAAPRDMFVSNNTDAISATRAGVDAYHAVSTAPVNNHQNGHHNGHFIEDESEPTTSDIMGDDHHMPSPVVSDLIRQVVRESCSETSEDATPRVSTPVDTHAPENSFSEVFSSLPEDRLHQVMRIQNMMKETKDIISPVS